MTSRHGSFARQEGSGGAASATRREVDVCIVGSGAAGGTLAMLLSKAGLSVVVLEAGPKWTAKDIVNEPHVMDERFTWEMPSLSEGELRAPAEIWGVGGATNHWGAVAYRFRPSDFQVKTLDGVGEDWPIRYDELAPYYERAEVQLGVAGDHRVNPGTPMSRPYPMPPHRFSYGDQILKRGFDRLGFRSWPIARAINSQPYDNRPRCNYCGYCHSGCMISAIANTRYTAIPPAEAAGAEVRPGCYAREVTVDQAGRARGVIYFDAAGREHEQRARLVILGAAPTQTVRLLLNSRSRLFPDGLANSNGQVGRNGSSSYTHAAWGIFPERIEGHRGLAFLTTHDLYETSPKHDFVRGYTIISRTLMDRGLLPENFAQLKGPIWGQALKAHMQSYTHCYGILANCSAGLPDPRNTITIVPDTKDRFGVPVAKVTGYVGENDKPLLAHGRETIRNILDAAGAREVFFETRGGNATRGVCRMGRDPKTSVVDKFGRCHDVKNLFIAGASTFVNGAPVANTLTIVALANLTADYIVKERRSLGA